MSGMKLLLLAPLALLAACGGSADPPAAPTNGAAAPAAGAPDNRINCKPVGAALFERACTVESAQSRDGRILTIRKADGGFRRLLIDRQGNVLAADGAEPVTLTRTDETGVAPIEVEIGGDRFRLESRWVADPANELNPQ
jgi:hypothetical protein